MRGPRSVFCGLSLWSLLCVYLSTTTAGASSHYIVDGCYGSSCGMADNGKPVECASDDATKGSTMGDTDSDNIAVQCCSIDGSSAERPGCVEGVTFDVAEAHCESAGLRLCTKDEVLTDIGRKTGCGFSNDHVWTSTPCSLAPELFVEGTDKTTACPDGYAQATVDECLEGVQYLIETTSSASRVWQSATTLRSWASSADPSGCIVYLYNGEWQHFFNSGGSSTGSQSNRLPVCALIAEAPTPKPSEAPAWEVVKQGAFACTDDYSFVAGTRPSPTDVTGYGCYMSMDLNPLCVARCEEHCEGFAFADLMGSQCTCFNSCPITAISTPVTWGILKSG